MRATVRALEPTAIQTVGAREVEMRQLLTAITVFISSPVSAEVLESVRKHHDGLQSFRSMSLIEARRRKTSALRLRFSQSFARRRHLPSQANVRSTSHRRGRTSKPLAVSDRFTISVLRCGNVFT